MFYPQYRIENVVLPAISSSSYKKNSLNQLNEWYKYFTERLRVHCLLSNGSSYDRPCYMIQTAPEIFTLWHIIIHCHSYIKFPFQGCTLRKYEGSSVLWTYEIQGAQHAIPMRKPRFSSCLVAKVRPKEPPGSQPVIPVEFISSCIFFFMHNEQWIHTWDSDKISASSVFLNLIVMSS